MTLGALAWRMRSSPAKGWAKTGQMAPPLAQSPPPGKEEQGRRESERKGRKSKGGDELEGLRPLAAEPSEREGCQ